MSRFGSYLKGCKECVNVVDKALRSRDITLSKEEQFDYYFKTLLLYREEAKKFLLEPTYRLASFYAKVFHEAKKVDCKGYHNDEVVGIFKSINRASFLCVGKSVSFVAGDDSDGVFCVYVGDLDDERYEVVYEVYSRESLIYAIEEFAQYLVSHSKNANEFVNTYVSRVFEEVVSEREPQPYVNLCNSMTLSSAICKNSKVGKIVYFRNLGGDVDGRVESGLLNREYAGGGL